MGFVIEGSECRESAEKTWECKVALILWHFDRFDSVMQVEMDILELQDFKMNMEALDGEIFGASEEASGLLDEVRARLERRLRIVKKFKHNRAAAKTLPEYDALSKSLATAAVELQVLDRRRSSHDGETDMV